MWLSKKIAASRTAEREGAATDMGVTTIGGARASVMTRGEQRNLEVFAPGGLVWQPSAGDTVLVLKGGSGCQEQCVVACETARNAPMGMVPGELFLYSAGGGSIYLKSDGSMKLIGDVTLTGDLSVEGDVAVTGNVSIVGDVTAEGHTTMEGRVDINGSLFINGVPYRPCNCA